MDFIVKSERHVRLKWVVSTVPCCSRRIQEQSMFDFVNRLKNLLAGITNFMENSPVGASESNGVMKRDLEVIIRVLADALEIK